MPQPVDILRQYWGYQAFRPLQEDIIHSILAKKDTMAILPTGGGKSICYQVPSLLQEGITLVVSPLIALMKDQVEGLQKKGITAFYIHSGLSRKETIQTLKLAGESNCRLLYVSPERLESALFLEYLPSLQVSLIAVDEAHCISQWGYDFRPSYLKIAALREELPEIPILALTASATPEVQEDISNKLLFRNGQTFRQSFERPNLSYSVFNPDSRIHQLKQITRNVPGSAIVYCRSRKKTREVASLLELDGIAATYYHAGLSREERSQRQEAWINDEVRVIVSTNAFGMGIDKPDVRSVIHYDLPESLENYYQEAGRAGRDGKKSYAVLLYDDKEIEDLVAQAETRYPPIRILKQVYQSVCNFLQVAEGATAGLMYDFDFSTFCTNFRLEPRVAMHSLKALEQEGWISFQEQVFFSSTLQFTSTREAIENMEKRFPKLEPLIKSLLRSYEGILDFPVNISESFLAKLLSTAEQQVKKDLLQLHMNGLVNYNFRKETPQLIFLRDRLRASDLSIDEKAYEYRKKKYLERAKAMSSYAQNLEQCRALILASYFGDKEAVACGICDTCLRQKKISLPRNEYDNIVNLIHAALAREPIPAASLMEKLSGVNKEKAWKVLNHLQSEELVSIDREGKVSSRQKKHSPPPPPANSKRAQ